jgi:CRISPR-associated endonuclease/helicase Cas3
MTRSTRVSDTDYESFFERVTGFAAYPYQGRVAATLLGTDSKNSILTSVDATDRYAPMAGPAGQTLVVSAPTGAGKTWATVMPFIYSRIHARPIADRLLYALPLRSLADSLYRATHDCLGALRLEEQIPVRLQTGETGSIPGVGDPLFAEGRIIFCTIDQLLSSYLGIPFSVSPRMANINAGALMGSLIVFDEYHLLDPEGSFRTALLLARHLGGVARVVWMTATQAKTARDLLCERQYLNALTIEVGPKELPQMPSQRNKQRVWRWSSQALSATAVVDIHLTMPPERRRTLVILNTVKRAQQIYRAIQKLLPAGYPLRLLHSRFLPTDRSEIEAWARQSFGRGATGEAILVATQVVEAGLDISAAMLHTELAPANALVQRAGRCARYEDETGMVSVYDTVNDDGNRDYRPYWLGRARHLEEEDAGDSETLRHAIDKTADEVARRHDSNLAFDDELMLIDTVHTTLDTETVRSFNETDWRQQAAKAMCPSSDHRNYTYARELIRDVDTVGVAIADEPRLLEPLASRIAPDFAPETISVSRVSVAALSRNAANLVPNGTWALMAGQWDMSMQRGSGFTGYAPVASVGSAFQEWLVATYQDRYVVLNPALARYTPDAGLELGVCSAPEGWQSKGKVTDEDLAEARRPDWCYRAEQYGTHVAWVRLHAEMLCGDSHARERLSRFWVNNDSDTEVFELTDHTVGLAWIDARLALPPGTARELALLAARFHDLGKLNQMWQEVVWKWQRLKAGSRDHYPAGVEGDRAYSDAQTLLERSCRRPVLLAHTDFDAQHRWSLGMREREVERQFDRPGHALESAWLAMQAVEAAIEPLGMSEDQKWQALRATVTAVAQHHSAAAGLGRVDYSTTASSITLGSEAIEEFMKQTLLATLDTERLPKSAADWEWLRDEVLGRHLDNGADWEWRVLETIVHRITRLADQRGTALGSSVA